MVSRKKSIAAMIKMGRPDIELQIGVEKLATGKLVADSFDADRFSKLMWLLSIDLDKEVDEILQKKSKRSAAERRAIQYYYFYKATNTTELGEPIAAANDVKDVLKEDA